MGYGGGYWPKPSEISLVHRGSLFLDELPEFMTRILEKLRQPLEDKIVAISRSAGSLIYPANFTLTASIIPVRTAFQRIGQRVYLLFDQGQNQQKKISGPLVDQIDIHVEVPRVLFEKLSSQSTGESSANLLKAAMQQMQIRARAYTIFLRWPHDCGSGYVRTYSNGTRG
jgi:magnesium chelatase family protein